MASISRQLSNTYRLVMMNADTFEEVGSARLSLLNIYVILSSILVIMAIVVSMLIAFPHSENMYLAMAMLMQDKQVRELYRTIEENGERASEPSTVF